MATSNIKKWFATQWLQFIHQASPPPIPTGLAALWSDGLRPVFRNSSDVGVYLNTGQQKSYAFASPTGGSGTYYAAGFYEAPAADANLTQAAPTQTLGVANISYAAHAFIVAAAAGNDGGGGGDQVGIKVEGTSITDAGVRTAADSEVLTDDITTLVADQYLETTKKWIGQVTYRLYIVAGAPAAYSLDVNYGFAKYENFGGKDFYLRGLEADGRAGANDNGFNVELLHHKTTGWTYNAAAFVPGASALYDMNTDHNTETDLSNGAPFAWKRTGLSDDIAGSGSEGVLYRITTGANNAVEEMTLHLGVEPHP